MDIAGARKAVADYLLGAPVSRATLDEACRTLNEAGEGQRLMQNLVGIEEPVPGASRRASADTASSGWIWQGATRVLAKIITLAVGRGGRLTERGECPSALPPRKPALATHGMRMDILPAPMPVGEPLNIQPAPITREKEWSLEDTTSGCAIQLSVTGTHSGEVRVTIGFKRLDEAAVDAKAVDVAVQEEQQPLPTYSGPLNEYQRHPTTLTSGAWTFTLSLGNDSWKVPLAIEKETAGRRAQ